MILDVDNQKWILKIGDLVTRHWDNPIPISYWNSCRHSFYEPVLEALKMNGPPGDQKLALAPSKWEISQPMWWFLWRDPCCEPCGKTGPICEPKVSQVSEFLWELQTPEPREPTGGFQIPDIFMSWTVSLHCVVQNGENLRIAQQWISHGVVE